jgi:hypothetical protein
MPESCRRFDQLRNTLVQVQIWPAVFGSSPCSSTTAAEHYRIQGAAEPTTDVRQGDAGPTDRSDSPSPINEQRKQSSNLASVDDGGPSWPRWLAMVVLSARNERVFTPCLFLQLKGPRQPSDGLGMTATQLAKSVTLETTSAPSCMPAGGGGQTAESARCTKRRQCLEVDDRDCGRTGKFDARPSHERQFRETLEAYLVVFFRRCALFRAWGDESREAMKNFQRFNLQPKQAMLRSTIIVASPSSETESLDVWLCRLGTVFRMLLGRSSGKQAGQRQHGLLATLGESCTKAAMARQATGERKAGQRPLSTAGTSPSMARNNPPWALWRHRSGAASQRLND